MNSNVSDFSSYELNLSSFVHNQNIFHGKNSFFYLLGFDKFDIRFKQKSNNCVVYQGHHGDIGVQFANVLLPSTVYVEKSSNYYNFMGIFQPIKKSISSFGNSRDD